MKPKFYLKSLYFVALTTILLASCTKELNYSQGNNEQLIAEELIRKVVGSKGEIVSFSSENNAKQSILSLTEFQQAVKDLSNSKTYISKKVYLIIDKKLSTNNPKQTNTVKSISSLDDEGPRRAGYYHVQFSPNSSINDGLGGSYTLHLYFNTDSEGRVIGSPSLSYTGIGIASWQQVNMSSISYNNSNYTSSFTISGINTYGIQFGSFTLGWSCVSNFLIKITMDESVSKQVTIIDQR